MRRLTSAVAMTALFTAAPSHAFDPTGVEILGLRLGMPETEILERLTHQGYKVTRAPETITAATPDGQLNVNLSPEHALTRLGYVFYGRGAGAPAKIQQAVMDRFGAPDQAKPMTWCQAVEPTGMCPPDRASMTFLPDSLTLLLRATPPEHPPP